MRKLLCPVADLTVDRHLYYYETRAQHVAQDAPEHRSPSRRSRILPCRVVSPTCKGFSGGNNKRI
jgi:hypothetical protein